MSVDGIRHGPRSDCRLTTQLAGGPILNDAFDPDHMKATQRLHDVGQSLWLDDIDRDLFATGSLQRYIDELSVTGLTSNPAIFDHAIKNNASYDDGIRAKLADGKSGAVIAAHAKEGIDVDTLAAQLQDEGAKSFVRSWRDLMGVIASKSAALAKAG